LNAYAYSETLIRLHPQQIHHATILLPILFVSACLGFAQGKRELWIGFAQRKKRAMEEKDLGMERIGGTGHYWAARRALLPPVLPDTQYCRHRDLSRGKFIFGQGWKTGALEETKWAKQRPWI
jgi:hypothetical protein